MAQRIEDYALIGDTRGAALVGRDGSVDWWCSPRFDSPALVARLLGTEDHGYIRIHPDGARQCTVQRRYRDGTMVLETEFETESGRVRLTDFMPISDEDGDTDLVRLVEGLSGCVAMRADICLRFDYGAVVPWVRAIDVGIRAIAGPDAMVVRTPVQLENAAFRTCARFTVEEGQRVPFCFTHYASHWPQPEGKDVDHLLGCTEDWWREWSDRCTWADRYRPWVVRSLLTLKALSYRPSGGIAAAPTTSLPEKLGGVRNWDYRFCWIRDATLTLSAFLNAGYHDEAEAWRKWLLRAVAGKPAEQLNIMYGLRGERRLDEMEADWLPGYEGSTPVHLGNAAYGQTQLDIFGEIIATLYMARENGLESDDDAWRIQDVMLGMLSDVWEEPDHGLWEIRGQPQHFTHSKMMAWLAADRAVKSVEHHGQQSDPAPWRRLRDAIHADICEKGFNDDLNAFVQVYGGEQLDASLLMMPLVGFLPVDDPRIVGTVDAICRDLTEDGMVLRYRTESDIDGLPPGEGCFLPCSFWLVSVLAMMGRQEEAERRFHALLDIANDVGLLAEEYDPVCKRQLGNFPQAFSHVALVEAARNLEGHTSVF